MKNTYVFEEISPKWRLIKFGHNDKGHQFVEDIFESLDLNSLISKVKDFRQIIKVESKDPPYPLDIVQHAAQLKTQLDFIYNCQQAVIDAEVSLANRQRELILAIERISDD